MKKLFSKFQYNAPVILSMTLLSAMALILSFMTGGWTNKVFFSVYRSHAWDLLMYLRMFTHILGHANYAHFIGNFTIILLIGPVLEEKYGSKQMLEMILITAFITGLIQIIFFPGTALLGASGIAFMLILLSSFTNHEKGKIPLTVVLVALIYLSGEVVDAVAKNDNVSQMGHIIGGICGTVFGGLVAKPLEG
ncbi:MAG: rhomboid family intramembrane serine protease [Oscillospiraceae bacterium]|nr:rhomboid family intramembrane serine protease [Oscillospiraceae bacterium]